MGQVHLEEGYNEESQGVQPLDYSQCQVLLKIGIEGQGRYIICSGAVAVGSNSCSWTFGTSSGQRPVQEGHSTPEVGREGGAMFWLGELLAKV